jgi:hypothetical protein
MAVKGLAQLLSRFSAIQPNAQFMRTLALSAVREQKLEAPRRTGNLGRTIRIGRVSASEAETIAGASYAIYVHEGTKPHMIPKAGNTSAKTLRWKTGTGGKVRFAKRVRHPGTKANPFMLRGARKAIENTGFAKFIIGRWNSAA